MSERPRFSPEWWSYSNPRWQAEAHLVWHADWPWWKKRLARLLHAAFTALEPGYRSTR